MPASMTGAERETLLAGVHVGVLSIDEPGRGPLSVPVWYLYEPGGEIVVVTRPEARKARLLVVGARVAFLVQSEELPPKYVTIQGRVVSSAPAAVGASARETAKRAASRRVIKQSSKPGSAARTHPDASSRRIRGSRQKLTRAPT